MMGDRNFQNTVRSALDSIGRELVEEIDPKNTGTIHIQEAVQCLRRSYYDRTDPEEIRREGFGDLLTGLLRKLQYGSKPGEFAIDGITLKGRADIMVDDSVLLFRSAAGPIENPRANDILYLNACMWVYDRPEGVIVYVTADRKEVAFSLTRSKKMFQEVVRRVRVLHDLLEEQKTPIVEPSSECSGCQYYERCFITRRNSKQKSLAEMLGMGKGD